MHLTETASPPCVLSLVNLNIWLQSDDKPALPLIQNLTLHLHSGEVLGVVGRSGAAKTTLMLSLLGLLPQSFVLTAQSATFAGASLPIDKQGDEVAFLSLRGRGIGYIFQEPKAAFNPLHTVAKSFDELYRQLGLPKKQRKQDMLHWLRLVRLPNPEQFLHRYVHELSGGEARRISIAQVLALRPRLVIADEPTGALDSQLTDEILALLTNLCRQNDTALILVSHDLPSVMAHCDQLLALARTDDNCHHTIGTVQDLSNHAIVRQLLAVDYGTPTTPSINNTEQAVLELQQVAVGYRRFWWGIKQVLSGIDLQLQRGQIIGMMGASGIGKSTLAKAVLQLDNRLKVSGLVLIEGKNPHRLGAGSLRQLRRRVQLVMQEVKASLNPDLTILDSLLEAIAANDNQEPTSELALIDELLALCGLSKQLLYRYPDELSGGECQRICLVRALLARPSVLILDEPTAMLDRISIAKLLDLLKNINQQYGTAMLIISHDKAMLEAICHKIMALD